MDVLSLFENHFKFILPEIYLAMAISFLLPTSIINKMSVRDVGYLSIYILYSSILLLSYNPFGYGTAISLFNGMFIVDSLAAFVKMLLFVGSIGAIFVSFNYFTRERLNSTEYPILLLLATLGLSLLVSAYDLLSFYLSLELQALALYILAAIKRDSEFSTEAGLKYFILGAFSSGLLLFGISLLYGFTGITHLNYFSLLTIETIDSSNGIFVGLVFIIVALLFKMAAVPFHMWLPDVYEGSPTPVAAFFAVVPKVAVVVITLRFLSDGFYGYLLSWQLILTGCSILSMVFGLVGALYQVKIMRLLAYSAISHVGYMLMGISVGTPEGIQAFLVYIVLYMITILGIFSVILSLTKRSYCIPIKYLIDLKGLAKTNSSLAFALALLLFSLAGVPPLAGFYGKLLLFMAALQSSMYFIALVGLLTSVGAAMYYLRLIKIMYFDQPTTCTPLTEIISFVDMEKSIIIALCSLITILFFCYPTGLLLNTYKIGFSFCS